MRTIEHTIFSGTALFLLSLGSIGACSGDGSQDDGPGGDAQRGGTSHTGGAGGASQNGVSGRRNVEAGEAGQSGAYEPGGASAGTTAAGAGTQSPGGEGGVRSTAGAGAPFDGDSGGSGGAGGAGGAGGGRPAPPTAHVEWDGTMPDGVCSIHRFCRVTPNIEPVQMNDVWGSSAEDVWAVGETGTILHFDGTRWTGITNVDVADSREADETETDRINGFRKIHGTAPDDVWVIGTRRLWGPGALSFEDTVHLGTKIYRYDGMRWQRVPFPGEFEPLTIAASARDDVLIAGVRGASLRWNGTSWEDGGIPPGTDITSIWAAAPGNYWVAGGTRILELVGTTWEDRSTGIQGSGAVTAIDGHRAVGAGSFVWDGTRWIREDSGSYVDVCGTHKLPESDFRKGCWAAGPDDVWEARNHPIDPSHNLFRNGVSVITGWNDSAWSLTTTQPEGVFLIAPAYDTLPYTLDVLRWDGTNVVPQDTGIGTLDTLAGRFDDEVWVTDNLGFTSFWNGSEWHAHAVAPGIDPTYVSVADRGEAYVGAAETLYEWTGAGWAPLKTFPAAVVGVASDPEHLWVRAGETLYARRGSDWDVLEVLPQPVYLSTLRPDGLGSFWRHEAYLGGELFSFWNGAGWTDHRRPSPAHYDVANGDAWYAWGAFAYRLVGDDAWLRFTMYPYRGPGGNGGFSLRRAGEVWVAARTGIVRYND